MATNILTEKPILGTPAAYKYYFGDNVKKLTVNVNINRSITQSVKIQKSITENIILWD